MIHTKLVEISAWNDIAIPIANISAAATMSIEYNESLTEEEKDLCGKYIDACVGDEQTSLPEGIEVAIIGSTLIFRKRNENDRT